MIWYQQDKPLSFCRTFWELKRQTAHVVLVAFFQQLLVLINCMNEIYLKLILLWLPSHLLYRSRNSILSNFNQIFNQWLTATYSPNSINSSSLKKTGLFWTIRTVTMLWNCKSLIIQGISQWAMQKNTQGHLE